MADPPSPSKMNTDTLSDAARPLIDLIDTLRSHGVQQDLPLPRSRSWATRAPASRRYWKQFPACPFLGTGLVTRCATQLIMSEPQGQRATASALRRAL